MIGVRGGIVFLILSLWPALAGACQCDDPIEVKVKNAESIFYAQILGARVPETWDDLGPIGQTASTFPAPLNYYLVLRYRILDVLKGAPDPDGFFISTIHLPGLCAPPILAGLHYVVFIDSDGYSDFCKGLFQLGWTDPQHDQVVEELTKLRSLVAEGAAPEPGDRAPQ